MLKRILLCGVFVVAFSWVSFADEGEEEEKKETQLEVVGEEVAKQVTVDEEKAEEAETGDTVKGETQEEKEAIERPATEEKAEEAAEPVKEEVEPQTTQVKEKEEGAVQEEAPAPVEKVEQSAPKEKPIEKVEQPVPEEKQVEKKVAETAEAKESHRIWGDLLLWLPNRLIDLNDVVSIDIGAGSEFALEAGITKFFSFGGANGEKYFLMKGYNRQFGGGYDSGWNYQMAFLNSEMRYFEDTFGSVKKYYKPRKRFGLIDYRNFLYEEKIRDLWAIEAKVGWLAVLGVQIHPVEFADFLAGIFFIDFKNDDLHVEGK